MRKVQSLWWNIHFISIIYGFLNVWFLWLVIFWKYYATSIEECAVALGYAKAETDDDDNEDFWKFTMHKIVLITCYMNKQANEISKLAIYGTVKNFDSFLLFNRPSLLNHSNRINVPLHFRSCYWHKSSHCSKCFFIHVKIHFR